MTFSNGSTFPSGVEFGYVPIDLATIKQAEATSCGKPFPLDVDKLLEQNKGHNVLFVAAPGAFTPACTESHVPGILNHLQDLKENKDITAIVFITVNDPFVNNAWGKLLLQNATLPELLKAPKVIFATDTDLKFAKANGVTLDMSGMGFGVRTGRFALVVDADSKKVKYAGIEEGGGVSVSAYEAIAAAKL